MKLFRCPRCKGLIAEGIISVDPGCGMIWWSDGMFRARYMGRIQVMTILFWLTVGKGNYVSVPELITRLYEDNPDGGAEDANGVVHTQVIRLRKYLADSKAPIQIEGRQGWGYRLVAKQAEHVST